MNMIAALQKQATAKRPPKLNVPLPLVAGTKVIIKLGAAHRQYSTVAADYRGKWITGVIDWVADKGVAIMEVRVSRAYASYWASAGDHRPLYLRVEYENIDCFNFSDAIVIRKQDQRDRLNWD